MSESLGDTIDRLHHKIVIRDKRIAELEAQLYDAYGLGIDDGLAMERDPLGLGGKTKQEVLAALEVEK